MLIDDIGYDRVYVRLRGDIKAALEVLARERSKMEASPVSLNKLIIEAVKLLLRQEKIPLLDPDVAMGKTVAEARASAKPAKTLRRRRPSSKLAAAS